MNKLAAIMLLAACGDDSAGPDPGSGPRLAGCPILPVTHIFNTPINTLPVHPSSDAFITSIGATRRVHLDLGTQVDQTKDDFYGVPFNVVDGNDFTWPQVAFTSADSSLGWNPLPEADCGDANKTLVRPCTTGTPHLPIPASPLVEGGISTDAGHLPYADHHMVVLDRDTCWLWETYHSYKPGITWEIFGAAAFDLTSNDLRAEMWTSSDAAGFPILPLLLRGDEADDGEIKHALRFTLPNIRGSYTWPATHQASNKTSTSYPEYGQLFRLKASYVIPSDSTKEAKAVLTAMQTYGMYVADGGSALYVTGEPSAAWNEATILGVQQVTAADFEAVDLAPIKARPGWSATSGNVPP